MDNLIAEGIINPGDFQTPAYPIDVDGEVLPKMTMEPGEEMAHLILEPDDLMGNYDFIPDVESMSIPDDSQMIASMRQMIEFATNPQTQQLLVQEGYTIKLKELMEDFFERLGKKDANKYFEKVRQNEALGPGQGIPQAGSNGQGMAAAPSMGGSGQAAPGGLNQQVVPQANRIQR